MDLLHWSKLILSYYRYLETSVRAIDKYVLDKCLYTQYKDVGKTLDIVKRVEDIANYIDRKRKFVNLKVIVEEAILEMPITYQKLLVLKYFDNATFKDIASVFGVNIRTIFRYKNLAIKSFTNKLNKLGYNFDYFNNHYAKEKWLFENVYNCEVVKTKLSDFSYNNFSIVKAVLHL